MNLDPKFVLVGVGDGLFAFSVGQVKAVVEGAEIFPLPQLPSGFLGVVLHGDVPVPVCVGAGFRTDGEAAVPYLLLGRSECGLVAFPVDRVLTTVGGEMLEEADAEETLPPWQTAWIRCRERRVPLIDIDRFLASVG
ncbi:chemotaxis signal transduction protein [Geothermobacter ehrlichii]|uniref:Chemotaxis signal transduction protein n=1 Tax=Geothermobacter ehrlichii TaxID=213224 RepID=A0A5D3WIY4_9BACT|nr:chemotaxis protein CheW [Geothermobacter ehrlichii]TYO98231.1 chemotaxis signal transduction protein [Geothermobacter ehrlichii]